MAAVVASLRPYGAKGGRVSHRDHAADPNRLIKRRRALLAAAGRELITTLGGAATSTAAREMIVAI
jgi:hypothetical protein